MGPFLVFGFLLCIVFGFLLCIVGSEFQPRVQTSSGQSGRRHQRLQKRPKPPLPLSPKQQTTPRIKLKASSLSLIHRRDWAFPEVDKFFPVLLQTLARRSEGSLVVEYSQVGVLQKRVCVNRQRQDKA